LFVVLLVIDPTSHELGSPAKPGRFTYSDEEEAVRIANDTTYGLAAYVQGERVAAEAIARRLRAGQVYLNNVNLDLAAPFGGYKQSGNGREWGPMAIADFLEIKAIIGFREAA
jgi:aldehyde dehydrogenase (NAD+)